MGYNFTIKGGVRVKNEGDYPWPCGEHKSLNLDGSVYHYSPPEPDRTIHLYTDDVLTKDSATGKYMKHTGLGCFNIVLTDDQVEPIGRDVPLRML